MATNRKKKEDQRSSGNGASFGDIERQQREEAQRQIQSVSRESKVNTKQAEKTMDAVIQRENEQARQQTRQFGTSMQAAADAAEYLADNSKELARNITNKVNKSGNGLTGDALIDDIILSQMRDAQQTKTHHDEGMENVEAAVQQAERGLASGFKRTLYDAPEGYLQWAASDKDRAYMLYAAQNQNADLSDMGAGQRYIQNTLDTWEDTPIRDAVADYLTDEDKLYQQYMINNQMADPGQIDEDEYEELRRNIQRDADIINDFGTAEYLQDVYDKNENKLTGTMIGNAIESAFAQTPQALAAMATGGLGLGAAEAASKFASLGTMAYSIAGSTAKELMDQGYDPDTAMKYGAAQALVELGTENLDKIPGAEKLGGLINSVAPGQAMGLRDILGEGVEEFVGQLADPFTERILNPDMTLGDAAKQAISGENLAQAGQSFLEGALSAGIMSGASHPAQTMELVANDIQNLKNLPTDFSRGLTQISNQINKTNEYEKALSRELIDDPIANNMDAEAQQARKAEIRDRFLSNENLRSEDALTREAAQAANTEYIKEQAKKYGINQNDADRITILSNRSGYMVEFADADQVVDANGKRVNGVHYDDGRIVLSDQSTEPIVAVAAHEIWHEIRGTQEASAFRKFLEAVADSGVLENFTEKYGNVEGLQGKIIPAYGINNIQDAYKAWDLLDDETSAYLTQELFGNESVADMMVEREPGLAQKVLESLQRFSAKIANNQAELDSLDQRRTIRKAVKMFQEAIDAHNELEQRYMNADLEDAAQGMQDRRYSKEMTSNGNRFVLSDDILGRNPSIDDVAKYADSMINDLFEATNEVTKDTIRFEERDKNKIINFISRNHNKQGRAVARIFGNFGELIEIATPTTHGNPKPGRSYGVNGWDNYSVNFAIPFKTKNGSIDHNVYNGTLSVRKENNGHYAYSLTHITDIKNSTLGTEILSRLSTLSQQSAVNKTVSNSTNKSSGNTPAYSRNLTDTFTDSEGRELTHEQQSFFRDSKIRDEDGNLRVVYHGTDQDFTVFDQSKGRANMDIQGSFFSPWEIDAGGYGRNVKAYYLNITNPASEQQAYAALRKFQGQNNAGVKAREYLESLGYDGVNNGDEEYIAFYPEQIKEVKNESPTSNPDVRYSKTLESLANKGVNVEMKMSFHDAVDSVLSGNLNPAQGRIMVRPDTPSILKDSTKMGEYVMQDLPMLINHSHISNAVGQGGRRYNYQHHMTPSMLYELPSKMEKPVLIYWNENNHSVNMILDMFAKDDRGEYNPVVVAISPDNSGMYFNVIIPSNNINTVFDYEYFKDNVDGFIDNVIYPKNIKKEDLLNLWDEHQGSLADNSSSIQSIADSTNKSSGQYSRNLLSEEDLARVNPVLVQRNNSSSFEDYKIPVKDGKIDTRAIDDDVWDKAVEITRNQKGDSEFTKRVYKKNKRVSDMAWISNILQQAQVQVDDDNRKSLGAEAFGGKLGYDQLMEKLRDKEGIRNAELLVDRYLKAIDHTGTANADRMIQSDPNGAKVAQEIKLRLSRDYVNDLQQAQNATIEKRNKTRNEGMVYGTEAYWRKTLKAEKENTENRIREILPETHQEVDIPVHRMSPMKMYRDYGTDDVHSPISDARQFLRANGITRTGDYTDFLKRIFLDTAEGRAHDPSMMSRFRDSILNNEQLASSSRMADGGFEYMIEQMDNAARDIMEAEKHMGEYGSYEEFANDNFTHAAVVPLTYDDHMSLGTRIWISGLLGTTANDPVVEQTVKAAESVIREASTDKHYDRTLPSTTEPYAKKLAEMCPLDTDDAQKVIDAAWNDMKYDHGRNSRGQYVNAPTQAEIDEATSVRKALSAARTREYFANKDSLEQMIEDAAANEEDLMLDDEYMDLYDQVFNDKQGENDLTSAYGEENYQFPSDEDAPEPTIKQKTQSAIQGIGLSDNEYEEATKDVDQGYGIKAEDYVPGKLESEMDEDDRSEARKRAEAMKEDIDIWMGEGQNLGSMAKSQEQNRDQMADGNQKVNDAIKRIVEDPFYEAKKAMFEHYKESVKKLSYITDKLGIAAGSDDSKYLQWYMEKSRDTNAENQREVMYTLADLKQDSRNWEKIVEAAKILEEMYDDYYTRINEALEMIYPEKAILEEERQIREMIENQIAEKQAYLEKLINDKASKKEIQRYRNEIKQLSKKYNDVSKEVRLNKRLPLRQNYVHHFQDVKPTVKNIWGAFMDVIKNEGSNNISNQLADISEWTQPNARWWGAMQQRNNGEYTPDAVGGMLRYMDRAEQKIFIDPYTAYMRGVIREMKNAADEADRDMSTTIRYYSAWVNDLAGKTNPYDRWLTYAANGKGRQVLTLLKMMNSRVKSNAVMGNLNSAIAQFYNLPNGIAVMQEKGGAKAVQDWTKGLAEYTTDLFSPDRAVDESVFLTERFFDDFTAPLADMTTPQKFTAAMMEFGDRAVAEQIWYAAKAQGERLGVSNPVQYADEITRRSVAGRGIGEVALQQKSEVVKILAPFQVEVNNQWQLMKHLVGEKQAASLFGLFLSTFLMNILKKKVTNTEGTGFDLFSAILDAFRENDTARDTIFGLMGNVAGETLSNMTMGALISELAGLGGDGFTSYFGEHDPTRYGIGNIGLSGMIKPAAQVLSGNADKVDWTKLITNYGLPYGGRQAERTVKTLQDMGYIPHFGNGVYGLKEGAYTSSGKLKYMIDKSDPLDVVRSLLFGSYASKAGSDYLENRTALGENSTDVMNTLVDMGADSYDAWQAMKSLKEVEYPAGVTNAKGLATRKALEDAGLWDEWSEAYMNAEDQDAFRSGTNNIGKKVAAMDDDEFQRAYDEIFGTGATETSVPAAEEESLPAGTESAPASEYTFSPSRQQAYDTVTSIDGIDSEALGQTMSSLESRNFTDADGNKIDNSKSAVNRLAYEEDGSYQIIVDFIESDENRNADDPLTYADFGLSKAVVNMSDEEYEELLEQINESTGSTYTRKSGGSSRGNSRRSNAFRMNGTSAVRSMFPNEQYLYDQLFG